MQKHLVLVGAGHAHLTTMKALDVFVAAGHRVTVISAGAHHYYSGMGPGMLAGTYQPQEVRFDVKRMVEDRGAVFIRDRVVGIDPRQRRLHLQNQGVETYDLVSFNTGSGVALKAQMPVADSLFAVKPIENLLTARRRMIAALATGALGIMVAGGGAAGVELAANIRYLVNRTGGRADIRLVAGQRLLARFDCRFRQRARKALQHLEIRVLEGVRVRDFKAHRVWLSNGHRLDFDFGFLAMGTRPSALFRDAGLPTDEQGGLLVKETLQSVGDPKIFGGGDCIGYAPQPLERVGVYAVRQNSILRHNLLAALTGGELQTFVPQKSFLLILNLGHRRGLLSWHNLVWQGRLAFALKNYLDRSFMRRFQVSGETQEETQSLRDQVF